MINIDEILSDKKKWKKEKKRIRTLITSNFEKEGFFNKRIEFVSNNDRCLYSMKIADYYINLMFWRPMIRLGRKFTQDSIFDLEKVNKKKIKEYIDTNYTLPYLLNSKIDRVKQNVELAILIENLKSIVEDFGLLMGISYNLYEVIQLMESDPEFDELIHTSIPDGLQPFEIEELLKVKTERLKEKLIDSNTGFSPLLACGQGLSDGQLQEFMLAIGNKPDLKGVVYPQPINTNVLIGGINRPSDYFIDVAAGRKSLIMNKKFTGDSGYFSRKLTLNNMNIYLDTNEEEDCHTRTLSKIKVEDEKLLNVLSFMNYKIHPASPFYAMIKPDDKFLIGKTIYLRSPLTCAKKHGICKKCYGGLYHTNKDIHIGEYAAAEMGSQFTQKILSAKHSLTTKSERLIFDAMIANFFELDNGFMSLLDDVDSRYYIRLNKKDLMSEEIVEETDEDDEPVNMKDMMMNAGEVMSCSYFDVVDNKGNVILHVVEKNNNMPFTLTDEFAQLVKKYDHVEGNHINIKFKTILDNDIEMLFNLEVLNNELTKTLGQIKTLLENENHMGFETRDAMFQGMLRFLIDGKIHLHSTHTAVILRNLFRDSNDLLALPDYGAKKYPEEKGNPPYTILTLKKSIFNHPSPIISLSLETVEAQLARVQTYRKTEMSFLDDSYRIKLRQQQQDMIDAGM